MRSRYLELEDAGGSIAKERHERKATRRVWSVGRPTMSRTGPERRQYLIRGTGRPIDQWRDRCLLRSADRSEYRGMLGQASIFHPAGGGGGRFDLLNYRRFCDDAASESSLIQLPRMLRCTFVKRKCHFSVKAEVNASDNFTINY